MSNTVKYLLICVVVVLLALSLVAAYYLRWDELDPPALPGSVEDGKILHDGLERSWFAYLPASRGAHPPVVLVLHGSQGSGKAIRAMSFFSFDEAAERDGFIAVYPDGYKDHWNDCRAGADYAANRENIDDVGFLRALVAELVQRYGADPQRVYAAGYSNGGQMAFRLALEAPDLVAGVAAIAANLPVAGNLGCEQSHKPVAVLVINGTADPVNPYAGGLVEILGDASRGEVRSAEDTMLYFGSLAGYGRSHALTNWPDRAPDDGTSVTIQSWWLPGKPRVELVTVEGGGHTIPNPQYSLPRILGPTSHEFDSAQVAWGFFRQAGS